MVVARTCKVCKTRYEPTYNTLQPTCGEVSCAITHGKKQQAKQRKATDKAFKQKVRDNDKSWHMKTLQAEFNKFIRLRDHMKPCISCGTMQELKYDAGHYRSVGACPELRFEEFNVHKQCSFLCNQTRTGNIAEYRIRLIKKIGLDKVEWLEGPHEPKKYTIDQMKEMIADYRARNKRLA